MMAKKIKETEKAEEKKSAKEKYFYALGKRKTAVAQVKIYPVEKAVKGMNVNGITLNEYFPISQLQGVVTAPFLAVGRDGKFDAEIKVSGGGKSGQAEAVRLGISRALVNFDGEMRKVLKSMGFLKRDARVVERKKPGLKKARRAPQWAKR